MKPNAELAWRVLDHIDAHPEQWDQESWATKNDCGTAACFAGWTCLLSGDKPVWSEWANVEDSTAYVTTAANQERTVSRRAAELLGIKRDDEGDDEGDDLFNAYNTRDDLGRLVAEIFGPPPTATA